MTSEQINTVRTLLTIAPQTVPTIQRAADLPIQTTIDALCILRGNGEARCVDAIEDGREVAAWISDAGGVA